MTTNAPYASRIKALRERRDLGHSQLAEALSINLPSYWDLEAFDDELPTCLTLRQAYLLASMLGVTLRSLLAPSDELDLAAAPGSSFEEMTARLGELIEREGLVKAEEQVGWGGLKPYVTRPASTWESPLIFLQDVCAAVGLDWFETIPTTPPPSAMPQS